MLARRQSARQSTPGPDAGSVRRYRTTPDLIADALREEIQRGTPGPGEALRQEEVAARFSVSRIPVREALRQLEAEGLVVVYPNRGAYVAQLSAEELREITDLRVLLEGDLVARAVPRMTPEDLSRIEDALRAGEREAGGPRWSAFDTAFHAALYGPAQRPHQLALVKTLRNMVERYHASYQDLPTRRSEWLADHRAIVAACRRGDAKKARVALVGHVERAGAFLLRRHGERR